MEILESIWFYLEPYVFISEDSERYLFYNTLLKKGMIVDRNDVIDKVVTHLQQTGNMYSILIPMKELEDSRLYELVQSLQEAGYGDIIEGELSKPIIMPPLLSLQKSVARLKKNGIPVGENILLYLHDVTIHLNGSCSNNCRNCKNMFKQYSCCTKSDNILDFNQLKEFLQSIAYACASINITGGNPFQYTELYELLEILGRNESMQTFIVNYQNIPDDLDSLYIFTNKSFCLKITVCDSYQTDSLVALANKLKQVNINQQWEIGITSESEYEKAEYLSEQLAKLDIRIVIKPYFDGNNIAFFEENIYVRQEDILSVELDRQNVFALQALNTNDFGKLTITSDGKVYANINREPIGNIQEPIGDILCGELENETSWRFTRYQIEPCNRCCYKLVCPSPSNYELAIGRPNLCYMKTGES
jgi:pseudo-rSAM protein